MELSSKDTARQGTNTEVVDIDQGSWAQEASKIGKHNEDIRTLQIFIEVDKQFGDGVKVNLQMVTLRD